MVCPHMVVTPQVLAIFQRGNDRNDDTPVDFSYPIFGQALK